MSTRETLESLLERNVRHVLRAYYIDIGDGQLCQDFMKILRSFIGHISRKFEEEIRTQLAAKKGWREADLISWTVSEISTLQSITISRLYFKICETEGLAAGQHHVDCRGAHAHAFMLSELYEQAKADWRRDRSVEPLSPKHRAKKRNRWAPWLVDLAFR